MLRLEEVSETVVLDRGEFLFVPGDKATSLYITLEGILKFWYWEDNREEIIFFSLVPSIFFNYHCSFGLAESTFYCEACNSVRLIRISKENYDMLAKNSLDFCHWSMKWMSNQLYHFEMKMYLRAGSAKKQYEALCSTYPELIRDMPLQDIASYLKITPQYLSKLRRK